MKRRGSFHLGKASVLMCTYNNEKYIREAIESICLSAFSDLEIVIMDDCSQDCTYDIIADYAKRDRRIKLFRNEKNIGTAKNAKRGIQHCTSQYIFFAAGDDISFSNRIQRGIEIFESYSNVGVIIGNCQVIDERSNLTGDEYVIPLRITNENIAIHQFKRNYCLGACMAIRKDGDIFKQDHVLQLIDDYQISLEYLLKGYDIFIDRHPLIQYRIHDSNVSNNRAALYQRTVEALRVYESEQIATLLSSKQYSDKEIFTAIGIFNLFRERIDEGYNYLLLAQRYESEDVYVNYENLFYLAVVMWLKRQYAQSLRYFLEAREMYPLDATVHNNIGVLKVVVEGNVKEAYDMFTKSLNLQPEYLDCKHNIQVLQNGGEQTFKLTERIIEERIISRKWYKTDNGGNV
jgi:glycosyltransferase involved in cell wall biosynthesis